MGLQGFDLALKATLAVASILQSMPLVTVGLSLYQKKVVKILIGHGETISQNLGRIGAAESWGATPLYQALMAGAWQLTQCRETRKVLIVVTDLEVMDDLCRQTVDDLEKAGFLVIGISIGDPDFADAFRNFCCISDVRELDTALFNAVSKIFR